MPLDSLDSAAAYSFTFTIDGIEVPRIMDISGLKAEVDKISHNQQTKDGKFLTRQLIGRQKAGTFTVTRGLTESATITDWLKVVMDGDITGARKTAEVGIADYKGEVIKRISYENCWVSSVEIGNLKAGSTEVLTEKWTVCFDTCKFEK
jgi:phage tail-like protein